MFFLNRGFVLFIAKLSETTHRFLCSRQTILPYKLLLIIVIYEAFEALQMLFFITVNF